MENADEDSEYELKEAQLRAKIMRRESIIQQHHRMLTLQRVPSYTHVFDTHNELSQAIEEHAVVGNLRTVALVSTVGNISWYCYPGMRTLHTQNNLGGDIN